MSAQQDPATGASNTSGNQNSSGASQPAVTVVVPEQTAVAVEYPGYIRNVEAALATLGGEAGISAAVQSDAPYLTLRLRPQDPYSHPLFSDKPSPALSLLLRISRPKDEPPGSTAPATVAAVARVTRACRFSGLADFQYLPPQRAAGVSAAAPSAAAAKAYALLPEDNRPEVAEPFKRQEPFLVVPPLFSRLDMPSSFSFKDSSDRPEAAADPSGTRASRVVSFYDFSLPGPLEPPGEAEVPAGLAGRLAELLRERPVWGMQLLLERLGGSVKEQEVLPWLHAQCYQFRTGPWKSMFIRCGYDPRSNPDSRPWQRVSYIMNAERHKEYMARRPAPAHPTMSQLHSFSALPTSRTTFLQLADLQDTEVVRLLLESPTPERASEAYGWFTPSAHAQVAAAVNAAFKRLHKSLLPTKDSTGVSPEGDGQGDQSSPNAMQLDAACPSTETAVARRASQAAQQGLHTQQQPDAGGHPRDRSHKAAGPARTAAPPAADRGRGNRGAAGPSLAASTATMQAAGQTPADDLLPALLSGLMEQLGVAPNGERLQQTSNADGSDAEDADGDGDAFVAQDDNADDAMQE